MTIIGIDLGTSNSAAAVLRGGRPVLIPSAEGVSLGGKAFPSYVAITADGQMLIGEPARRQSAANPEGTTSAFKRKMGTRDRIRLLDREFSPEQLSAFLLQKIKRDAEAFLGEPVTKAVVTVPAYFDDNQRSATKDAAGIAGLEAVRLVNEPTAASLAYGLDRAGQELRIAVIDLGGGTLDVTPLTLGVETLGGVATPLIARNTPVPVNKTESFTTAADLQTSVTVHVYQGERVLAADNVSLGEFNLDGIAPAPRGVRKIEVSFDIDANGILNVAARDIATGKSQSVRISGSTRLPQDVKQRMERDAEKYAEADKRRRADAEALNDADSLCYQAEKLLAGFAARLTAELKERVEQARRSTKEACNKKDAALAKERAEDLRKALKEAGTVIYAQTGQASKGSPYAETRWTGPEPAPDIGAPTGAARPCGSGPRGRVVDAEYKENH